MPLPFKTQRVLTVEVSPERRGQLAEEAAIINGRLDHLRAKEAEHKDRLKEIRGDMDARSEEISGKLRIVSAGSETVAVDCEWREHPERPMKQLWRLDTLEVIDEKPLEGDEGQRQIPGTDEPPAQIDLPVEPAAKPAVEAQAKKGAICCPFIVSELDAEDPTVDVLCGGEGAARRKGFCAAHYEGTGGKTGDSAQLHCLARRTRRAHLAQERIEREAAQMDGDAAGSA